MDSSPLKSSSLVSLALLFEGGMGLAAWALGWLIGWPPAATLHWTLAAVAWGCAASLPLVAVLLLMVLFPVGPFARLEQVLNNVVLPLFENCGWLDFALISLLAGVGEELMFRGLAQAAIGEWLSPAAGLLLASALFGLAHPITTAYAVMAAIFGLYLGLVWLWSGNLLVVVTTHAVYDFVALAYLMRRYRRLPSTGATST